MTRRHRKPKPRRVDGSLILVQVAPTRAATPADREVSLAKRKLERALIARGLGKRQALIIVSGLAHDVLLREAEILNSPDQGRSAWWRRLFGGEA